RGHDLAPHGALHLGHFLRPLVDEQHDQDAFRMVGSERSGDVLQQHRLARLRRRDDQAALALADRRDHVDDARRQVFRAAVALLELQPVAREQRRQVLEEDLALRVLGRLVVDLADLEQREVALAVLRRPDEAGDGVAGAQVEATDLARADVDVVRPREIRAVGGTQEAETVLQYLEHAVAVDVLAVLRVRLQDRENDVLLARTREIFESLRFAELDELGGGTCFQLCQVHDVLALGELFRRNDVQAARLVVRELLGLRPAAAASIPPLAVGILRLGRLLRTAACLITQISSHRLDSKNSVNWDLDMAPSFWAWTEPFLNSISVGMLRIPYFGGVAGFSSMLSLVTVSRSAYSSAASSSNGAIILQGPHHSAQKSTSTGLSDFRT